MLSCKNMITFFYIRDPITLPYKGVKTRTFKKKKIIVVANVHTFLDFCVVLAYP